MSGVLDFAAKIVYTIGVLREIGMPVSSLTGEVDMEKKITKAALVEFLRKMLTTNEVWATAALMRIYDNQTDSEKNAEETIVDNGIGFTGGDARILTSFAEWYKSHGWLSPKQMKWVYAKLGKYAGQLAKMEYFSWEKLEAAYVKANKVA